MDYVVQLLFYLFCQSLAFDWKFQSFNLKVVTEKEGLLLFSYYFYMSNNVCPSLLHSFVFSWFFTVMDFYFLLIAFCFFFRHFLCSYHWYNNKHSKIMVLIDTNFSLITYKNSVPSQLCSPFALYCCYCILIFIYIVRLIA